MDILGTAQLDLKDFDSNIGSITVSAGGVGRNIAQACSLMGERVNLVTCFADDFFGDYLKKDCRELGIDITYSKLYSRHSSSMYLAIMDRDGDMRLALSDMDIMKELDSSMVEYVFSKIDPKDLLVIDSNLNSEMLDYIFANAPCKLASDPVSMAKINKLKPYINKLSIFKPNKYEAEALSGIEVEKENYEKILAWFLNQGIEEIIITMDKEGALLGTKEGKYLLNHRYSNVDNATGGGDAFFGAYIAMRMKNLKPLEAIKYAVTAAVTNIETEVSSRRYINLEYIEPEIEKMNITIEPI